MFQPFFEPGPHFRCWKAQGPQLLNGLGYFFMDNNLRRFLLRFSIVKTKASEFRIKQIHLIQFLYKNRGSLPAYST